MFRNCAGFRGRDGSGLSAAGKETPGISQEGGRFEFECSKILGFSGRRDRKYRADLDDVNYENWKF